MIRWKTLCKKIFKFQVQITNRMTSSSSQGHDYCTYRIISQINLIKFIWPRITSKRLFENTNFFEEDHFWCFDMQHVSVQTSKALIWPTVKTVSCCWTLSKASTIYEQIWNVHFKIYVVCNVVFNFLFWFNILCMFMLPQIKCIHWRAEVAHLW